MILGAGEGQVPLIRRAKEADWETVVVSPRGDYPGFAFADVSVFIYLSDKMAILKCAQDNRISAIATDQTDISVSTVLFVAQQIGLPCIQCEGIENFRLKSLMRKVCEDKGLSFIPYCATDRIEEVFAFYRSLPDGLAIIKPIDSQGSRGVLRISSIEGVRAAFEEARKYTRSGRIIIEQFIKGHEIEVDTVVRDSRIIGTLIGDVYNFGVENSFSAYERSYPSNLPVSIQESVRCYNAKVISFLGLRTGWTHGEYMIDKDNNVFLLEIGARGGGNFIGSEIVREMLGVSTDEMAFDTAIGDSTFYERIYPRNCFCAYRCFYLPEGEVVSVDIADSFLKEPYILKHNLNRIYCGLQTHKNTDKTSRYTIVIKEMSREALQKRLKTVEQCIHVTVRTDDGIRGIIWR